MEKYLIDTSVFINQYRNDATARRFLAAHEGALVISFVTAGELIQGARNKQDLAEIETLLHHCAVDWGSEETNRRALTLLSAHTLSSGLRFIDALQAAVALTHGYTLVTDNLKHFSRIPGFDVISPAG